MKKKRITYAIVDFSASRAIYQGVEDLPRISLTFTESDGTRIEFDISLMTASKVIEQTSHAYSAAMPKAPR